ncbi:MAG: hypothetical protein AB7U62_07085, partial [Pseudolabrys sp.]
LGRRLMEIYRNSLSEAVRQAFDKIGTLAFEMDQVSENTREFFEGTEIARRRSDAAVALECIKEPKVPRSMADDLVQWSERKSDKTRPERRDNIVRCLNACISRCSGVTTPEARVFKRE